VPTAGVLFCLNDGKENAKLKLFIIYLRLPPAPASCSSFVLASLSF